MNISYQTYSLSKITSYIIYARYRKEKGMANKNSDVDLLLDSGLRGLKFVGLMEDVRIALDKEVDIFDQTHIIPDSKIFSEISRDGVVIYEE